MHEYNYNLQDIVNYSQVHVYLYKEQQLVRLEKERDCLGR